MANPTERETSLAMSLRDREVATVVWESIICAILVLSAFLGNAVLCLSLYKTKGFRAPQNYYITSLAITDMLFGALCMSLSLGVLIKGRWAYGPTLCQLQGSLIFIAVVASMLTMTLIAINRYFKICKSINVYRKLYSRKNILLSIAFTWICSIAIVVVVFSFSNRPFRFHPGKFLCFLDMAQGQGIHLYTICAYLAVCVFIFPVITFCYFKVYKTVHKHFSQIAKSELSQDPSRSFINEANITKMLFITLIAFLLCWAPSVCLDLFEAFHGQFSLPRQVYFWQVATFACSSVVNPVIYGFMRKELRTAYKNILTCRET